MQVWDEFLKEQESKLGKGTVDRWLRPLKVVHFDACNLYLEAPHTFQTVWFEEHLRSQVDRLVNQNNRPIKVHLTSLEAASKKAKEKKNRTQVPPFQLRFDELDPNCTLDRFIVHSGNELPHKLISGLCTGFIELASFNPIFLHGPEGAGKSHLMMAVAHNLREQGLRVIYARGETFSEHVVSAIRAGEMELFRNLYRKADILLIDDVQILGRKTATQEELHHTFNALHTANKQIILSANGAPQELRFIEPRLISRFEWGIAMPLEAPAREQLCTIAQQKADALNFKLNNDLLSFLLEHFDSSPKSFARAIEALALRSHLDGQRRSISTLQAKQLLSDLLQAEEKAQITPRRIIEAVALHYGIQSDDLLGKSQKKEMSIPRQVAMYLCRKRLALPYTQIGDAFSRDHSTVMTSVKRIEDQCAASDSEMSAIVHTIQKSF